jgi:hypothetical protein
MFATDERQEIIENMRALEKQLDKSQQTDGSGPALFSLFNKRVKENLHIIFAMSPLSPKFRSCIASLTTLLKIKITMCKVSKEGYFQNFLV